MSQNEDGIGSTGWAERMTGEWMPGSSGLRNEAKPKDVKIHLRRSALDCVYLGPQWRGVIVEHSAVSGRVCVHTR